MGVARGGGSGLHGWVRADYGQIVARFHATDPSVDCGALELLLIAPTRADAVRKAKQLGLHGVHLTTNPYPPTDDEAEALRRSGEAGLWRPWGEDNERPWLRLDTLPLTPRR
jgi:hypothetical protein